MCTNVHAQPTQKQIKKSAYYSHQIRCRAWMTIYLGIHLPSVVIMLLYAHMLHVVSVLDSFPPLWYCWRV